jgi:broad specificity phosphatase PhoE
MAAVQHIADSNPEKKIVVCTHGGTLWGLISYFDPSFGYDQYRKLGTPDVKRFFYDGDGARFDSEFRVDI